MCAVPDRGRLPAVSWISPIEPARVWFGRIQCWPIVDIDLPGILSREWHFELIGSGTAHQLFFHDRVA